MSTSIMSLAWPVQMPPPQKAVLISLADNANDSGHCWPSISFMAQRTCLSERTVIRAIKWLESNGYIKTDKRDGRSTMYQIIHDSLSPVTLCHHRQAVTTPMTDSPKSHDSPSPRTVMNRKEPSKGSRLPLDFVMAEDWKAEALKINPSIDVKTESEKFIDYWHAKTGAGATKLDWFATWRNWCRNARPSYRSATQTRDEARARTIQALTGQSPQGGDNGRVIDITPAATAKR